MKHEFGLDVPLAAVRHLARQRSARRPRPLVVHHGAGVRQHPHGPAGGPVDRRAGPGDGRPDGRRGRHRGGAEQRGRRRPHGDPRLLGRRDRAALRDRDDADRRLLGEARGAAVGRLRAARAGPGPVAAVRDPAGGGAQHRRRRLPGPPAPDLVGRGDARELRHRRRDAGVLAPPGPVRSRAAQRLGAGAGGPRDGRADDHRRRGHHREALQPAGHRPARPASAPSRATSPSSSAPCWSPSWSC